MLYKLLMVIILFTGVSLVQAQSDFKYIGANKCKTCHKKPKTGEQFKIWKEGPHADAYNMLSSEKALKVAKEKGIADPSKAEECLKCHSTYFKHKDQLDKKTKLTLEEGVSCESCHGPGSAYKKKKIMKDQKLAISKGLIIPNEKTCQKCHNENSPTMKEFDFEKAKDKIKHPRPKKK